MKKLFSFLRKISVITLVLMMVIGTVDTVAYAAEQTKAFYIEDTFVNPRYYSNEHEVLDVNGGQNATLRFAAPEEESVRDAALLIKENMIARNENFSITIRTIRSDYSNVVNEAFRYAISEELASTPTEGDYLAWQYGGYSYSGSAAIVNGKYEYYFNFKVPYYTTAKEEAQLTIAVENALDELNIDNLNEYEKVKAIHDFVCKVCNYDYSTGKNDYKKFTAYAALIKGTAVCQGYSTLLYRLLKEAGIDNKIVTSTSHSWNIVKIDGKYYNVDATWDDNYYDNALNYRYFLTCQEHFTDHVREPQYKTVEFNTKHNMAESCYYDTHPELKPKAVKAATQTNITTHEQTTCTAHNYVIAKTVDATCTKAGYDLQVCSVCGAEKKVEIAAKGHKVVTDKAVAATFTKEGKTQGSHCATCNAVLVAPKTVAKLKVKGITLSAVKAKSKAIDTTWTKSDNATGYEVQYSTSKKFESKKTKTDTVKKNGTVKKTLKNLKGNTKYYIRVRAYKVENGKKYYSSWTTVKNVKTKK